MVTLDDNTPDTLKDPVSNIQQQDKYNNNNEFSAYAPINCYGKSNATFRVPSSVVSELVTSLHLTEPRWSQATGQLTIAISALLVNIYLLIKLPWFLLPLGWILAGVTLSNLFVISHDCAHNTFTSSKLVNRIIGELTMLPLAQPFAAYKQRHLKKFNKLRKQSTDSQSGGLLDSNSNSDADTDTDTDTDTESNEHTVDNDNYDPGLAEIPPRMYAAVQWFRDTYRPKVTSKTKKSVAQSRTLLVSFICVVVPILLYIGGIKGILKYWLLPLLAYKLMYRAYWTVITNNVNAIIPTDVNVHVSSYNAIRLAHTLQQQFKEANTTMKQVISHYTNRLNWINISIIFGTPLISFYGWYTTDLTYKTFIWSFIYYFWTGLGITAGYHRLWAHRAYDASFPVKLFLLAGGTGALEGSLKWWAGGHRVHHRYTDTPKDPYNSKGGFWYAHVGWMLVHPKPENKGYADIRDLNADPIIRFQHKYYLFVGPFMAFIFPALVSYIGWNDFWGGFFYAGYTRLVFVHHNTFCVNSVAHYFGEQTFDDERTPRDNIINAFFTFGEGYHNFHHEFPNDYRNGLKWYDYDPTKWLIKMFALCGLTYNLREFDDNAIRMGVIHMNEKRTQQLKNLVHLPPSIDSLPTMSYDEFVNKTQDKEYQWIIIDSVVHDIAAFVDDHPGGSAYIRSAIGKDGTDQFNGSTGIYRHSNAARNVLAQFRIARLDDYNSSGNNKPEETVAETEIKEAQQLKTDSAKKINNDIHATKMSNSISPDEQNVHKIEEQKQQKANVVQTHA